MNAKESKKTGEAMIEAGVTNKERFLDAVEHLTEMDKSIRNTKDWLANLIETREKLASQTADYAQDHVQAMTRPLVEIKPGIFAGEIDLPSGKTARLTVSKGGAKRMDGGNLTQLFLASLPDDWVDTRLKIAERVVNSQTDETLAEHGLCREVKRVWSQAEIKG